MIKPYYQDSACVIYHGLYLPAQRDRLCRYETIHARRDRINARKHAPMAAAQRIRHPETVAGSAQRLQADSGAYREAQTERRSASSLERRTSFGARRTNAGASNVSKHRPVRAVRRPGCGTASHRREHGKQ